MQLPVRLRVKDPFCGISHAVGAVLGAIGVLALLVLAGGRPALTVGFAVYGLGLVALYTGSTLYHSVHGDELTVARLQRLDHATIFLLIAGTYTPVCLVVLPGPLGYGMLAVEWVLAAIGVAAVIPARPMPSWLRVVLYCGMGWLAAAALGPLRARLPASAIAWMLAGGIVYTMGTVVYATERPNLLPGRFEAHDLWHVFVLGGSACHFVMMFYLL